MAPPHEDVKGNAGSGPSFHDLMNLIYGLYQVYKGETNPDGSPIGLRNRNGDRRLPPGAPRTRQVGPEAQWYYTSVCTQVERMHSSFRSWDSSTDIPV